jgi:hypothetical protein
LVAKNRTRIPYCIKNDMANFLMDYFRLGGKEDSLMVRLEMLNEEHRLTIENKTLFVQNTTRALNCFLFSEGIGKLRRTLLPRQSSAFMIV